MLGRIAQAGVLFLKREDGPTAVEYAVLDRAGRLQLPREMTQALGMRDRVRLESEVDHIGVWPDDRNSNNHGSSGEHSTGTKEGGQ